MKYRRLTKDELDELEKEFIQFLAVNGIDAPKWQEIKSKQKEDANQLIDTFSDLVIEKSLQNIKYVEHGTSTDYKIFFYDTNQAQMIGVKSSTIDLLKNNWTENALEYLNNGSISIVKGEKNYTTSREEELFEMTQKGCMVTEGMMYNLLKKLVG